jgi:hypothetical protein
MSAPGGGFGEGAHDDEANQPPSGDRTPQQPAWEAPWDLPASPPASEYPPPAYPPPGYPPGYPAEYPPLTPPPPGYGQPPGYGGPPPTPPPPGYGQPPGYGGPPYLPAPPPFGGPPPGYGPPSYPGGYPGGYYPTPDHQGSMQPGTNGLAIASLVSSFTGFLCCFVGSILAIVLGVVALNQIKQTRQNGYGMAVAGIVIGIGTLLVFLIIATFRVHFH